MAGTMGPEVEKRIKALRKKLTQIEKLKSKGDQFTVEEAEKVAGEGKILAEIRCLEKGETYVPPEEPKTAPAPVAVVAEPAALAVVAPAAVAPPPEEEKEPAPKPELAPEEAEKKIRALKKKMAQIDKLKEKGANLTKEEAEKVSAEQDIKNEITDLEIGLCDAEPKKAARALQKKLDQIQKLRKRGGALTLPEKEKLSKESALSKELQDILNARPVFKAPAAPKDPPAPKAKPTPPSPAKSPLRAPAPAAEEVALPAAEEEPWAAWQQPEDEDEGFVSASRPKKGKKGKEAAAAPTKQEQEEVPAPDETGDAIEDDGEWEVMPPAEAQEPVQAAPAPAKAAKPKEKAKAEKPPPAAPTEPGEQTPEKRIKALKKKLTQIEKLRARGAPFTAEEQQKLASEAIMVEEMKALERGETWEPPKPKEEEPPVEAVEVVEAVVEVAAPEPVQEAPPPAPKEPDFSELAPAEAEKRIKAIRKKLTQIQKLKEGGKSLSAEEAEKVANEANHLRDVALLQKCL